jgi:hypothetical protein
MIPAVNTKRRTMIRNQVGCCRESIHILPSDDFVYGYKQRNDISVKETLNNWSSIVPKDTRRSVHTSNGAVFEGPFGNKTEISHDSIKNIVQTDYTNYRNHDTNYPEIPRRKKIVSFPAPKATLSSTLVQLSRQKLVNQSNVSI